LRVQDSPDYLVNRVDKEIEGPFGEIFCTEIEKSTKSDADYAKKNSREKKL